MLGVMVVWWLVMGLNGEKRDANGQWDGCLDGGVGLVKA